MQPLIISKAGMTFPTTFPCANVILMSSKAPGQYGQSHDANVILEMWSVVCRLADVAGCATGVCLFIPAESTVFGTPVLHNVGAPHVLRL